MKAYLHIKRKDPKQRILEVPHRTGHLKVVIKGKQLVSPPHLATSEIEPAPINGQWEFKMIDLPERLYDQLKNVAIANALAAEAYGFIDEYK